MHTRRGDEDLSGIAAVPVRDEDGIAGIGGVVREARSIRRPDRIHPVFNEGTGIAAHGGRQP